MFVFSIDSYVSFQEEFVKIASVKRSRKDMKTHWDKINPFGSGAALYEDDELRDFKTGYRTEVADNKRKTKDVPFKVRAESYRHYKKTGRLPSLDYDYNTDTYRVNKKNTIPYSTSKDMVTMYHGGDDTRVSKSVKNPKSMPHQRFVIPGETKTQSGVLWLAPKKDSAESYARMGRTPDGSINKGTPTLATITAPRNKILMNTRGTEATIGSTGLRKAKIVLKKLLK